MTGPVHLPPHTSQVKSLAEMIRAILAEPKTGNWQRLDEILAETRRDPGGDGRERTLRCAAHPRWVYRSV